MPPATTYVSPNPTNASERALIVAATDERSALENTHNRTWAYYEGNHRKPLRVVQGKPDNNVIINRFAQAVDRMGAFLFPEFPGIELDDSDDSPDEQWLRDCLDWNDAILMMHDAFLYGALDGHCYVKVLEAKPDEDYPRFVVLPSQNMTVFWRADDMDCVLWYQLNYSVGMTQYKQDIVNLTELDKGSGWHIFEYQKLGSDQWTITQDVVWPYDLGPIVDWKHQRRPGRYYGVNEGMHITLNDAINKVASDVKAILRSHAFPKTFVTGMRNATDLAETAIDSMWTLPDGADVKTIEMQSNLESSMTYLQLLDSALFAGMRVAMVSGGPDTFKNMTNLGIKAIFMDMIAKNETLRRSYGKGIKNIVKRLLMLGGKAFDVEPRLVWGSALPTSDLEETQVVQTQIDMGILSKESAAGELGIDWELEEARLAEESDGQDAALERLMAQPRPFDMRADMMRQQSMNIMNGDVQDGASNGNGQTA